MTTLEEDKRFADALEECCRRVRRGEILEHCLADYPGDFRDELTQLVPLACRIGQVGRDPAPEFQSRLEQRLLTSVDAARRARRTGMAGRVGSFFIYVAGAIPAMRIAVMMLVALVLFAASGVGAIQASEDSLPDEPLYSLKAAREWAELLLARNDGARADIEARQIGQRGREMERALQMGKSGRVVDEVATRAARSIERLVDRALLLRASGNPRPANRTLAVVRVLQRRLARLASQASPSVLPAIERLQLILDKQEERLTSPIKRFSPAGLAGSGNIPKP
ncbi:MAG: hypothetical protein HYY30_10375 [Chloroflexi bacterium]|nr:hypothetical protein [Chloroflexota bacterium]